MRFINVCALPSTAFRFELCMFVVLVASRFGAGETITFDFEEANGGPTFGVEYGSQDGFPAFVRDGFVIDVEDSDVTQSAHFHETDSILNPKVPDRPNALRGVLWKDGEPAGNPLVIVPETSTFVFSITSLVVGASSADGSQTSAVELSAFLGSSSLATVQLAAPIDAYTSYSGSALGPLDGVVMDRLEVNAIGAGAVAYFQLDDLVFETTVIPEPRSLLLFALGGLMLLSRRINPAAPRD